MPSKVIIDCLQEVIGLELVINYEEIGVRISSRRKELNMTQGDLSKLIDMSVNQISNLENNHAVPTISTILKLSRALGVTPDYFLLGISKSINGTTINRIAEKALLFSEKQQNLIYEFMSVLRKED